MINKDLVIIGGGSAGMAAAIQAKQEGIEDILILEKEEQLGGILNQCIHPGFGLSEFKEELTGPEYLERFASRVRDLKIPYKLNACVNFIHEDMTLSYTSSEDGVVDIKAKAIVVATGCYERSAANILLPGDRCSGVITAGAVQKYLNINGYLVGKKIVILGSGDIGLIMARRFTMEGAKVICIAELMPYCNGLNRNLQQCVKDFDIPLYLSTTVKKVIGKSRVEKVILAKVDEQRNFIPGTEQEIECDTLVLSVGLTQYLSTLSYINFDRSGRTAPINDRYELPHPGIFICGNSLHVHDVVDFVSDEGRKAGHFASKYIKGHNYINNYVNVQFDRKTITYILPTYINTNALENVQIKFRVSHPLKDVFVKIIGDSNEIKKVFYSALIPSEMINIEINYKKLKDLSSIKVEIESK